MKRGQKIAVWIIGLAALTGFVDASYLYYEHVTASTINCFLFDGCNAVAASPLSKPFGIPLSLLGLLFYLGMFTVLILYVRQKKSMFQHLLFIGSMVAFILSLYFIYLQGFVIEAFCVYCMISALAATSMFCTAIYLKEHPLSDII